MDQCEQGVHVYPWISVNRVFMLIYIILKSDLHTFCFHIRVKVMQRGQCLMLS